MRTQVLLRKFKERFRSSKQLFAYVRWNVPTHRLLLRIDSFTGPRDVTPTVIQPRLANWKTPRWKMDRRLYGRKWNALLPKEKERITLVSCLQGRMSYFQSYFSSGQLGDFLNMKWFTTIRKCESIVVVDGKNLVFTCRDRIFPWNHFNAMFVARCKREILFGPLDILPNLKAHLKKKPNPVTLKMVFGNQLICAYPLLNKCWDIETTPCWLAYAFKQIGGAFFNVSLKLISRIQVYFCSVVVIYWGIFHHPLKDRTR